MKKIAITTRYLKTEKNGNVTRRFYTTKYFKDIAEKLNIMLIPVFTEASVNEIAEMCDGFIIPGNYQDVDPNIYHELRHPSCQSADYDTYKLDKLCVETFSKTGKPVLGICAGIQIINVVYGGSLYQDIPNHSGTRHSVTLEPGSKISEIYGKTLIESNSYHHQCVKRIAEGFKCTAVSSDGTIEAIEKDNILAVQWHPEMDLEYEFFARYFDIELTD